MPLVIDARDLRRGADRALHRQLADLIRGQIVSHQLRPGESLPSEGDLADTMDLSKTAVRAALGVLVAENLVEKRHGVAARVAVPRPVRHMATSRYADELARLRALDGGAHPAVSAFTDDHAIGWDDYTVSAHYLEGTAGPDDARRLETDTGAPVLRRGLVKYVRGTPTQLQDSVMPLRLVAGTPVADPDRQPWPGGTIAELWSIGLVVTRVVEEARSRMSSAAEQDALDLHAPGVVFAIERIFYADDVPVEASSVVCAAPGVVLRWETELPR